jgi:hypothetical protein
MSFSDRLSDKELARDWRSLTVEDDTPPPKLLDISEIRDGNASKKR